MKSAPKMNVSFTSSREKTHVVHQIGMILAAKSHRMCKISCEQQNLPLHDPSHPLRQSWAGAQNSSFVCTYRQGLRNQRVRNNASALVPLFAVLVVALHGPAHEDVLSSVTAVTSLSLPRWVSEVRAASKSEVRIWCLTLCGSF